MKIKSLSIKIFSVAIALTLLLSSVFVGGVSYAKAEGTTPTTFDANNFFKVNDKAYSTKYEVVDSGDDLLCFAPKSADDVKENKFSGQFANKIAINDFKMGLNISSNVESVKFILVTEPYLANGNVDKSGTEYKLVEEVENEVKFTKNGDNFDIAFNSNTVVTGIPVSDVWLSVVDGIVNASLDGVNYLPVSNDAVKKVECVDKTMATIKMEVEYVENATITNVDGVRFSYIDQSVNDGIDNHNQKFELQSNGTLANTCGFVLDIDTKKSVINVNSDNQLLLVKGKEYSIKYNSYRLNSTGTPQTKIKNDNSKDFSTINADDKKIMFFAGNTTDVYNFSINDNSRDLAVYNVKLVDADDSFGDEDKIIENAPQYDNLLVDDDKIVSFKMALSDATKAEYEVNGETEIRSIRVGSGKYLKIPSMKDFVSDNVNGYDELKPTVYYMNATTSTGWNTYSGMKVPVNTSGTYYFFVIFADGYENMLDKEKGYFNGTDYVPFYTEDNGIVEINDANPYVFSFTVEDDAPITIKSKDNAMWYTNVKNTAASFTIEASDDKVIDYKLEYLVGDEWMEISQYAGIDEDYGYFTAEQIEAIGYDGKLTFTPNKAGTYRITCTVNQTNVINKVDAYSEIIVNDIKEVAPPKAPMASSTIWQIVFLSIGSLALVGVIVLLCVKPKEEI